MLMSPRQTVLSLYRSILRLGRTWEATNSTETVKERQYILHEAKSLFRTNKSLSSAEEIEQHIREAEARISIANEMDLPQETRIRLKMVSSVCQTIDHLLRPGFGPNGRNTLLTTSTGQVLITNLGASIIQCLNIENPVGHLITRSMLKCEQYCGDGSKTFLLYLAGIFSHLSNINDSDSHRTLFLSACQYVQQTWIANIILPAVCEQVVITNFVEDSSAAERVMTDLVRTQLSGKYPSKVCNHLCRTIVDFVCSELNSFNCLPVAIQACLDNFHLLCVEAEGRQPSSTCFMEGVIIQKDFLYVNSALSRITPAKFIILRLSMERENDETVTQSVCVASTSAGLNRAIEWRTRHCSMLVEWLKEHRINLVLSSSRIGDVLNGLCTDAGISTVQFVAEEDVHRIEATFDINAVDSLSDLLIDESSSVMGCSERCEPMVIGCKRFVHLGLVISEAGKNSQTKLSDQKMHSESRCSVCPAKQLIVYGVSSGACRQTALNLRNSLKALRAWTKGGQYFGLENDLIKTSCSSSNNSPFAEQCGVHLQGGGTFEMAVLRAVQKYLAKERKRDLPDQLKSSHVMFCSSLCTAMTVVPLRLLQNSYHPHKASIASIERLAVTRDAVIGVNGRTGGRLEPSATVIEPLETKLHVLGSVLELTIQLLRLDCILSVKTLNTLINNASL